MAYGKVRTGRRRFGTMIERIRAYIKEHEMLRRSDKIIVGISGGADSVCLLCVLLALREEYRLQITAVHVHHGLRGEASDADADFVRKFCEDRQVPLAICRVDVRALASRQGWSLEEAGREARRKVFLEVLEKQGGDRIALAHHMDDNAETVLLNLARGTGLGGLGGIRPVNPPYIRPLLCVRREEIEKYLGKNNISYCIDETNLEDAYTRNRLRNHVIPYMEREINSKFVQHLHELTGQMRELQIYVERRTDALYERSVKEGNGEFLIMQGAYRDTPRELQPYLIRRTLGRASGRLKDLEAGHVRAVEELFGKQTGRRLALPYGLEAVRCYEGVRIGARDAEVKEAVREPENCDEQILCRVFERQGVPETFSEKTYTKWFDYDIIKGNLAVRNRQSGDYIAIDRMGNTQKIKKFFINQKIPEKMRDRIWLIAEGSQILWIVGYRQSKKYQVTEHTRRILEISIVGGTKDGRINQSISVGEGRECKN